MEYEYTLVVIINPGCPACDEFNNEYRENLYSLLEKYLSEVEIIEYDNYDLLNATDGTDDTKENYYIHKDVSKYNVILPGFLLCYYHEYHDRDSDLTNPLVWGIDIDDGGNYTGNSNMNSIKSTDIYDWVYYSIKNNSYSLLYDNTYKTLQYVDKTIKKYKQL